MSSVDLLCDVRCQVGESPLWLPGEQALYWVDIEGRRLHRWRAADGRSHRWQAAERLACIAPMVGGGFVAGMEDGIFAVQPQADGTLATRLLARASHAQRGMRFNDGRTDRAGRFWAGTMVMDMTLAEPAGVLHRLDGRGLSAPLVDGLLVQNGLGFSPDGRTMYLSDSHPDARKIWAFDLSDDGTPSRRRLFVDMNLHPGRPDGCAVDTDGALWVCANDGHAVLRFTPDGRLDRTLALPVSKPSMCAFGGAAMDELYITTIRPASPSPAEAAVVGAVFVCRPGAQGLAEVPFVA
jgi:sugar lactone lactonase YvrE